jgi:hypothetical protein
MWESAPLTKASGVLILVVDLETSKDHVLAAEDFLGPLRDLLLDWGLLLDPTGTCRA